MALLTLETEQTPCHWSALETKLAGLLPTLEIVAQSEKKRSYSLIFADQGQPLAVLTELQALLAPEDIHFYIDLRP